MTLNLLYFAWVREGIGRDAEQIALSAATTIAEVADRLAGLSEGHARVLADRSRLRAAVNGIYAGWDATVRPGDELAIFPPVTGG